MTGRALRLLMRGLTLVLFALVSFLFAFWLRNHQAFPAGALTVVQYIDVGDGDCTAIRTVDGSIILFDTGGADSAPRVIQTLRAFHAHKIDLLVLGASDDNSIGGVPAIVAAFPVRLVWDNPGEGRGMARQAALEAIRRRHIDSRIVHAGDTLQIGSNTYWSAVWPPEHGPRAHIDGLVCRLDYGSTRFLFEGPVPGATENYLVAQDGDSLGCADNSLQGSEPDCTDLVVQAPGAGSNDGTSAEFLKLAEPALEIISCGRTETPDPQTLERLESAGTEVWRTDRQGTVTVWTDGHSPPEARGSR
jgi:competence protein ComEC